MARSVSACAFSGHALACGTPRGVSRWRSFPSCRNFVRITGGARWKGLTWLGRRPAPDWKVSDLENKCFGFRWQTSVSPSTRVNRDDAASMSAASVSENSASPVRKADANELMTGDLLDEGEIPPEVDQLFGTLRDEALKRLDEFAPIHLFSLCWAYSTARLLDADLELQIQGAALRLGRARDADARILADQRGSNQQARRHTAKAADVCSGGPLDSAPLEDQDVGLSGMLAAPPACSVPPSADLASAGGLRDVPYVLAQTEQWMAVYKPPFWQVSVDSKEAAKEASVGPFEDEDDGDFDDFAGDESTRSRPRMQAWIQQNCKVGRPIHNDPIEAFGLMHRLDVQTSGLLLCAKTYVAAYWIRLQWCSYNVDKEYICLVHGWVDRDIREIHKRIRVDKKRAPNSRRTVSTHCSVSPGGKPSFTELTTLMHLTRLPRLGPEDGAESEERKYSLVALKLHTGRTHQIRVHMLSIGHPLVCDVKYAEDRFASDRTWCPRNFLHTFRLGFDDVPTSSEDVERRYVEIFCALPRDLAGVLRELKPADEESRVLQAAWCSGDSSELGRWEDYACKAIDRRKVVDGA